MWCESSTASFSYNVFLLIKITDYQFKINIGIKWLSMKKVGKGWPYNSDVGWNFEQEGVGNFNYPVHIRLTRL